MSAPKAVWEKNGSVLYLGDCREVLPTLERVDGAAPHAGQQQEVVSAAVHVHWDAHSGRGTRVSTDYMAIELDDRQAEWLIATLTEMRQAR